MISEDPKTNSNNYLSQPVPVVSRQAEEDGSNAKTRFQELWAEAQNLKQKNQALESALDRLVERVQTDIGAAEMEMGRTMRRQIDKLIVFAGRRSLAQWQMQVLDEWILATMEILQPLGLVDDALRDSLAMLQAGVFGIEIDPDSDLSVEAQLAIGMDAQLSGIDIELGEGNSLDDVDLEDVMQWFEEEAMQSDFSADDSDEFDWQDKPFDEFDNDDAGAQPRSGAAKPETVFKTLFHRVARALHPDKETDEKKRAVKQALMAQLLAARRDKDLIQVFTLYQEHVSDTTDFGEHELAELESVLLDFIDLELDRQTDITTKSYLHEMVYSEFYSDDPAKVNRTINRKLKEIEKRKRDIDTFSKTVTSLKKLKPYLEARYDHLTRLF